uniref:Uncharacterized protein n=1 Tax=Arundo donax TaxID=35708 RepID=A0A0A9GHH1_ARUDO
MVTTGRTSETTTSSFLQLSPLLCSLYVCSYCSMSKRLK